MCGLCGIHAPAGIGEGDRRVVAEMTDCLAHRGPDGDGRWEDGVTALGHRRLAIIDLPASAQPMTTEDGLVTLVYNGEVYDYRDLRRELEGRGHRFRTAGDTEVVLRGYEEWGDRVVERLRGMFAFAVRDGRRDRLLLARDRLGVKPLHFHEGADDRLLFASEIKALLLDPAVPRQLDRERVPEYLLFRATSGDGTMFRGIRTLPPGTVAVREGGGPLRLRRYWSGDVAPMAAPAGREELVTRGRALLDDAVASRLVSDVPVGSLNSGGLDSSLMAAIAARHLDRPLDTFIAGFEDPAYDERPHAREVARAVASRHHELVTDPLAFGAALDRLAWANDEPIATSNAVPMHEVLVAARREGVTVILSGEGADEVFGGYSWFTLAHRRATVGRLPAARALTRLVPPVGRLARVRALFGPDRLLSAGASADLDVVAALAPTDGHPAERRRPLLPAAPAGPDDLFAYAQRTYLQPILHRQDRMGMAAGVEVREPFLDHPLVEWANALPVDAKLAGGVRKALLKEMAAPDLPQEIIHRAKVGFAMPTAEWFGPGGPLAARRQALLEPSSVVAEVTERAALEAVLDAHARHGAHRHLVWALVALDTWARVFLGPSMRRARLPGAPA